MKNAERQSTLDIGQL